ncbi:flavodoxin family protein [Pseudoalteromonas sp. T1lg65]|uniref:flavodoxin family protein n=1 Tax=Pseudoalteromonas sp. T1lg65 TaxID=2077101 RepID=UPI003F7B2162
MHTVILYSSSNRFGNTYQSASQLAAELNAPMIYVDEFEINDYCYQHSHADDDFRALFRRVLEFDHIVFASPVYWYAITPKLKAFFDRITDFMDDENLQPELRKLREKHFSILSTSIYDQAPEAFTAMLLRTCQYLGMAFKQQYHFKYDV